MKTLNNSFLLIVVSLVCLSGKPIADCRCQKTPLYGRVKVVEHHADFDVRVVEHHADLHVQLVESHPNRCGRWQMVDSHPDFTIQLVKSHPDFTIRYVDSHPGAPPNLP